jgi:uncharacterized protein (DUF2235 family)/membrane protease YdiL (CAAX protease family)
MCGKAEAAPANNRWTSTRCWRELAAGFGTGGKLMTDEGKARAVAPKTSTAEPRNLVLCLDGTGNEVNGNLSNVLKLFRIVDKEANQLVFYDPGVGTVGQPGWWSQAKQKTRAVLGLALGLGLDDNVLNAYSWLCKNWRPGDEVYIFGFSRGAYTARVLAGFIHLIGLLRPEQLNICGYALVAYKRCADSGDMSIGWDFKRVTGARSMPIRFVGCWDTVASVIVPRPDRLYLPSLQTLPYTRTNESVEFFRHAIAMDERRRMFRLNRWVDPQTCWSERKKKKVDQDIRQVFFAGVHSDVGGGYPEDQSGLSKYPLIWMLREAETVGLRLDEEMLQHLVFGGLRTGSYHEYKPPSATAELHVSLTAAWWLFEVIVKSLRLKEWPCRSSAALKKALGLATFNPRIVIPPFFYVPWAEPRPVPNRHMFKDGAPEPYFVHTSVLERIRDREDYRPVNLPKEFAVEGQPQEPGLPPPEAPPPVPPTPFKPAGFLALLRKGFTTLPDAKGWKGVAIAAAVLTVLLGIFGWMGGYLHWQPRFGRDFLVIALIGFFVPVLAEEVVFRGFFVRPPPDGTSGFGPVALGAVLFMLWHPFQAWFFPLVGGPQFPWYALTCNCWFLASTLALGFACGWVYLKTRSLLPAVLLHWAVVLAWKGLFGAPLVLPW